MIDFHTHTFLSDGVLGPAEHIRRAEMAGYRVLGIADHADLATMEWMIPILRKAAEAENARGGPMRVLAGVELTHVRADQISEATAEARRLGAAFVICHGQTLVEPVEARTNRAAIEAGVDILAHPGAIEADDVVLAAQHGVRLEITAKAGHCLTNGHVAALALQHNAPLIFGSDCHGPTFPDRAFAEKVMLGSALDASFVRSAFEAAEQFADECAARVEP